MAFKPDPQLIGKSIGSGFGNAKTLLDIVEHKMDRNRLQGIADQMRAGNFEDAGAGLVGIDRVASGLNTMNIPVQRQQIQFRQDDSDRRFQRQVERDIVGDDQWQQTYDQGNRRIAATAATNAYNRQSPERKRVDQLIKLHQSGLLTDEEYQEQFNAVINPPDEYGTQVKGRNEKGEDVYFRPNKTTGGYEEVQGFVPPPTKTGLSITTPDGTVIQQGGDPNRNLQGNIQQDKLTGRKLINNMNVATHNLARAKSIKALFKPEFLQFLPAGTVSLNNFLEKAGATLTPEQKTAVKGRQQFETEVRQMFNAYRKLITGAAASVQEMKELEKAMINMNMAPTQFEAALARTTEIIQRTQRINNKLLRQGLSPSENTAFGSEFDMEYYTGGDDTAQARFADYEQMMRADGTRVFPATPEGENKIYDMIKAEGYKI